MAHRRNVRQVMARSAFLAMLALGLAVGGPTACASGRQVVIDDDSGQPIEGVAVVGQLFVHVPLKGMACFHVDAGLSDASGRFSFPPPPRDVVTVLGDRDMVYLGYKKGFRQVIPMSENAFLPLRMKRDDSSGAKRMQELARLARLMPCLNRPRQEIVDLLEQVIAEAAQTADSSPETATQMEMMRRRAATQRELVESRKRNQPP